MTNKPLTLLGIETSCDETAASVIVRHPDGSGEILSNIVRTQLDEHAAFGGVVPEIAARSHSDTLSGLIKAAMMDAKCEFKDLDGVGATAGPGLIGGLLVGSLTAKAIAAVHKIPYIAVNHLEGHALTVGLTNNIRPPYLLLLVSGGHTQLLWVSDVGEYTRIGTTIDDALGEAFDKTAKLLGLDYPGGPSVEKWAKSGDPKRFSLPSPLKGRPEPNFSFSGLKTALRQHAEKCQPLMDQDIHDLCASFQHALVATIMDRLNVALQQVAPKFEQTSSAIKNQQQPVTKNFIVAGGVAANQYLRTELEKFSTTNNLTLTVPPAGLCTDNAAMIAWAAAEQLARGQNDPLNSPVRSRWPLDKKSAPILGSGKSGAKA